jgi:hypothetical protein
VVYGHRPISKEKLDFEVQSSSYIKLIITKTKGTSKFKNIKHFGKRYIFIPPQTPPEISVTTVPGGDIIAP